MTFIELELRKLAALPENNTVFTFLATRRDNNKPITVDKFLTRARHKVPRSDIVQLAKSLDRLNLCNFVAGRRTFPSRILFYYAPSSIGNVALGNSETLERLQQTVAADVARSVIAEATGAQSVSSELPFLVQNTAAGTMFVVPPSISEDGKAKLVEYIQQMPLQRTA